MIVSDLILIVVAIFFLYCNLKVLRDKIMKKELEIVTTVVSILGWLFILMGIVIYITNHIDWGYKLF